jgi:cytochrome c oxidase subunit 2
MKRENYFIVVLAVMAGVIAAVWGMFAIGDNMPRGVTEFSRQVYDLHMVILWICVVIGVLVFTAMFVSIALHRKSRGVEAAQFSHSTKAEILWTIIPILILVAMAVPATKTLIKMEETGDAEMNIKITGYQWRWKYDYLEDDISFLSSLDAGSDAARQLQSGIEPVDVDNYLLEVDNPLVVPVGTKIRFLLTAGDVIHSWWVPALGWKRDTIPGSVNEAWTRIDEPGTYRGQCAELCGKDHGFMPIVVEAVSKEDYAAWISEQQQLVAVAKTDEERLWTLNELMSHGENVYATQCATCHQGDGQGLQPAFPALAGSQVATGPVADHIKVVLQGRNGTAMRGFSDMLSAQDIAAALTYTRNAWGNQTGDVVQPSTIAQLTNG